MARPTTNADQSPVWEALNADYINLRGINFVPVYTKRVVGSKESGGAPKETASTYHGVASSTAMWRFYSSSDVGTQLGWVKRTGFNAVRVFMSYPAWLYCRDNPTEDPDNPNLYVTRWNDFVAQCEARGLYVMPVLWNGVRLQIAEPDDTDPYGLMDVPEPNPAMADQTSAITYWNVNPGSAMARMLAPEAGGLAADAEAYLGDCMGVFAGRGNVLLMWDVMNEPRWDEPDEIRLATATLAHIKAQDPSLPRTTTWSFYVSDQEPASVALALDPNTDVISIHPYGHTAGTLQSMLFDATMVSRANPPAGASRIGKPVICTEIGYPGIGESYRDTVNYCRNVPRGDLGADVVGIGFMPWMFMIGDVGGNHPFSSGTGLLYAREHALPGQPMKPVARDVSAVEAFVGHAIAQKRPHDPRYPLWNLSDGDLHESGDVFAWHVPQAPIPTYADDYRAIDALLKPEHVGIYGSGRFSSWEQVNIVLQLFRNMSPPVVVDPHQTGSLANGNPYRSTEDEVTPGYPFYNPGLETKLSIATATGPDWEGFLALIHDQYGVAPADFAPWANPEHRAYFEIQLLRPWSILLRSYFYGRQGPW